MEEAKGVRLMHVRKLSAVAGLDGETAQQAKGCGLLLKALKARRHLPQSLQKEMQHLTCVTKFLTSDFKSYEIIDMC